MVDLACDMKGYDYFHSDDPVEADTAFLMSLARVLFDFLHYSA